MTTLRIHMRRPDTCFERSLRGTHFSLELDGKRQGFFITNEALQLFDSRPDEAEPDSWRHMGSIHRLAMQLAHRWARHGSLVVVKSHDVLAAGMAAKAVWA